LDRGEHLVRLRPVQQPQPWEIAKSHAAPQMRLELMQPDGLTVIQALQSPNCSKLLAAPESRLTYNTEYPAALNSRCREPGTLRGFDSSKKHFEILLFLNFGLWGLIL
jgi:hypothetical protein